MTDVNKSANEYFLTQAQYDIRAANGQLEVGAVYHITDDKIDISDGLPIGDTTYKDGKVKVKALLNITNADQLVVGESYHFVGIIPGGTEVSSGCAGIKFSSISNFENTGATPMHSNTDVGFVQYALGNSLGGFGTWSGAVPSNYCGAIITNRTNPTSSSSEFTWYGFDVASGMDTLTLEFDFVYDGLATDGYSGERSKAYINNRLLANATITKNSTGGSFLDIFFPNEKSGTLALSEDTIPNSALSYTETVTQTPLSNFNNYYAIGRNTSGKLFAALPTFPSIPGNTKGTTSASFDYSLGYDSQYSTTISSLNTTNFLYPGQYSLQLSTSCTGKPDDIPTTASSHVLLITHTPYFTGNNTLYSRSIEQELWVSHVGTGTSATLVERKYRRFVHYANNSSTLTYGSWERADYPTKVTINNQTLAAFTQMSFVKCTQSYYNSLSSKDANTLYIIVG